MADTKVYTVAELGAQLERHAGTFVGRRVLVHGLVITCGPLSGPPRYCLAPDVPGPAASLTVDPLPLLWAEPDRLHVLLWSLSALRNLVPAPQTLHLAEAAVYRVQIRLQPEVYCGEPVCYQALLLDAAPGIPDESRARAYSQLLLGGLFGLVLATGFAEAAPKARSTAATSWPHDTGRQSTRKERRRCK
jgi:hypothetical protein